MLKRKRKEILVAPTEKPGRIALPETPPLPEVERSFFDLLLRELYGALQETEKLAKKTGGQSAAVLRKCAQTRGTVAYAKALLRLEALKPQLGEPAALPALLNGVLNGLRREFLYAGVTLRRPEDAQLQGVAVPEDAAAFLLEEMIGCCLRCTPEGKNLYINAKRIGPALLLSLRSEGAAVQQAPLIPLLHDTPAREEDYGFAMCAAAAALLGWTLRWEADEAGVRMFADIPLSQAVCTP